MNNARDTMGQLRGKFDGQDPFMTGGHQIIKTRQRERTIPEWTKSNKSVQGVLLLAFPKLNSNARQRVAAARWASVIHLYYRMKMTRSAVSAQTKIPVDTLRSLLRNISRVAKGLRADGTGSRKTEKEKGVR